MAGFHIEETAEPAVPTAASMRAADPALVARYRLVASREPAARPPPVRAEVIHFDPTAPFAFPSLIAGRLSLMRAAEAAGRVVALEVAE